MQVSRMWCYSDLSSFSGMCMCVCAGDEDSTFIMWMNLKKGAVQRCGCGHWFQLVQANPTKLKQEQMQRSNSIVDIINTKRACMYCDVSVFCTHYLVANFAC